MFNPHSICDQRCILCFLSLSLHEDEKHVVVMLDPCTFTLLSPDTDCKGAGWCVRGEGGEVVCQAAMGVCVHVCVC